MVDELQCERIAKIISQTKFRPTHYQREILNFSADPETKMRAYFFMAAICHQTHTLISKKQNLVGWEYLEHVFATLGTENSRLLDPAYLAEQSVANLCDELKPLFSDEGKKDTCVLDRMEERAGFIISISKILINEFNGRIDEMIHQSENQLFNNGRGLYEVLEKFPVHQDPLRKKSTIFIKLLIDSDLLRVNDPENFIPAMDYHMQRVLLRMGAVKVLDNELEKKLKNKTPIESDSRVREACVAAIKLISRYSGFGITKMDDYFWSLARSCCQQKILCQDGQCSKEPCTFFKTIELNAHDHCIFENVCKGSADEEYRKFWQPMVDTNFY